LTGKDQFIVQFSAYFDYKNCISVTSSATSPLGLVTSCSLSFVLFTEIKTKINKLRLGYKCYPKFIFSKQYSKFMTIIVGEIWVQGVLRYVCSHE